MKSLPIRKLLEECEMLAIDDDFEGILENTDEILKMDSSNVNALSYRVMSLYGLERYDETLKSLNVMLELDPDAKYFQYFKVRTLSKLDESVEAYEFYKSLNDNDPHKETIEMLAHLLIDDGEYERALDCLDTLNERNWLFSYCIVDGYKRISNHEGLDFSDRFDDEFYMSWISMIKYKTEEDFVCPLCGGSYDNQLCFCENCSEEINMGSYGTLIQCDDLKVYYYICDKLHTIKEFLKGSHELQKLRERMDCLDDKEFGAFIAHLKEIGYIVEASRGYVWDGDVMSTFCERGKYAAPRWLVFPGYTAWTMGWRMGGGEDYCMNEPPRGREFYELFPRPKNWMFNPRDEKYEKFNRIPYLAMVWDGDLNPKYSHIGDDAVEVNDFITLAQEREFRIDALHFKSIEHAVLYSKMASYNRLDPFSVTFEELKNDYDITGDELAEWNEFRFTVCLNATYYMFMQDSELKERLLATADKPLVYVSDDEWGGDDNLFGFVLMQVRDEIRRLCEHEGLIDWKYTEYIKHAYPYISSRDPTDPQSPEYKVVESTLVGSSRYVRDANLDSELAEKYEVGQILTEKAFTDVSSRIGGMATTHRYLILSQYMADFSAFEEDTDWGLHVAKAGSKFKVLDVFTVNGRTQILLLHLPEGFEEAFEHRTDVEKDFVLRERKNFRKDLDSDVIDELAADEWLKRCSFPIGMSDEGEFW